MTSYFRLLTGHLIIPEDEPTGCFTKSYNSDSVTGKWIALVERGVCPFSEKEAIAISLGASGLIVYQSDDSVPNVMTGVSGVSTNSILYFQCRYTVFEAKCPKIFF